MLAFLSVLFHVLMLRFKPRTQTATHKNEPHFHPHSNLRGASVVIGVGGSKIALWNQPQTQKSSNPRGFERATKTREAREARRRSLSSAAVSCERERETWSIIDEKVVSVTWSAIAAAGKRFRSTLNLRHSNEAAAAAATAAAATSARMWLVFPHMRVHACMWTHTHLGLRRLTCQWVGRLCSSQLRPNDSIFSAGFALEMRLEKRSLFKNSIKPCFEKKMKISFRIVERIFFR